MLREGQQLYLSYFVPYLTLCHLRKNNFPLPMPCLLWPISADVGCDQKPHDVTPARCACIPITIS